MKVRLESIAESELRDFLDALLPAYVEERALADHLPRSEAERFARAKRDQLLPQNFATPGHRFLRIVEEASGVTVGSLWICATPESGEAFVYDVTASDI